MKNIAIIFIIVVVLTSCFKEDDPIPPHPKGDLNEEVIPMTQYYVNQVYFSLPNAEQTATNEKNDFDLSFSCADTGYIIRLNTSTFMTAAQTEFSSFEEVMDTTGLSWHFDPSDGNSDSTALRNWIKINEQDTSYSGKVWVIDRGINAQGFKLGLKKAIFHKVAQGKYSFSYANMDNSDMHDILVEKDPSYNYTQFSFDTDQNIQTEPLTQDWDLLFTQYTTLLYTNEGEPYPYLVTGTLINPFRTAVAFDSTMVFSEIELEDVLFLDYSTAQDVIGYEWKSVVGDVEGGDFYYKTESSYNYFIRSQSGIFYKLHFTGFYDKDTGEKGYPSFEYQRL